MRRRVYSALLAGLLTVPGPLAAQSIEDRVIGELRKQGYAEFSVARTLLGRVRIEAKNRRGRREIVVNPRNGAILRDYFYPFATGTDGGVSGILGGSSGSGSSGTSNDDNLDDEENDEDEDDDENDEDDESGENDEDEDEDDDEDNGGNSGSGGGSGGGDDEDDDDDDEDDED